MSSDTPFDGLGIDVPVVNFAGTYLVGTPERGANLRRVARAAGWSSSWSPAERASLMGVDLWGLGGSKPTCPPGALDPSSNCNCPKGTELGWSDQGKCYACIAVAQSDGSFLDSVEEYVDATGKVLDLTCRLLHVGCPGKGGGEGGTQVPFPSGVSPAEPWYSTPIGIVGILLGVAAVGTGVYLVARK